MILFPTQDKATLVTVLFVCCAAWCFSMVALETADKTLGRSYKDPLVLATMGLGIGVVVSAGIKLHFIVALTLIAATMLSVYYLIKYLFGVSNVKLKRRYFFAIVINRICMVTAGLFFIVAILDYYLMKN